jgi:MFS family permease
VGEAVKNDRPESRDLPASDAGLSRRIKPMLEATFRSLRIPNFRRFFFGQLVSQTGTWMQTIGVVWLTLDLTDSGVALGAVMATQFLPVLLLGAFGGVVSDRVDPQRAVIVTQVLFTGIAIIFTLMTFTGSESMAAVYGLSASFGLVNAFDNPLRRVFIRELVGADDIANGVGLNSMVMTGSRIVGPAIAGALISIADVSWCFLVNAATYPAVIIALYRIDRRQLLARPPIKRAKGQLREGLRHVRHQPDLLRPLIVLAVIGTFAFEFQVSIPLLAERTLAGDAATYSLLFSTMSIGSVIGGATVARLSAIGDTTLARSVVVLGFSLLALTFAPNVPVAAIISVPVGWSMMSLVAGTQIAFHMRAKPEMQGRVVSLVSVVLVGSTAVGAPIVGWAAEALGARAGVGIGALATLAVAPVALHRKQRS